MNPLTSILTFLQFTKNAPEYIDPSGHFVFYDIFCSSNSYNSFFFNGRKFKYIRQLWINHPNFFSECSFGIYLKVLYERNSNPTTKGEPREQHLGEVRQGKLKLKININHRNSSVNLSIVFFYFYFVKKKFKSILLENIV